MFGKNKKDYESLNKILTASSDLVKPRLVPVLSSLDDVFFNFDLLINNNALYVGRPVNAVSFLKNKFEDSLSSALERDDSYALRDISLRVGFVFGSSASSFSRFYHSLSLGYAFKSLVDKYALTKNTLN